MKRKLIVVISLLVLLVGCTLLNPTTSPKRATEDLLGKYQSLDDKVIEQLDDVITGENLTTTQRNDYEELIRKQYQNLTYTIKEELIDGDTAIVTAEIEVYDFGKANEETDLYVSTHRDEFLDDNDEISDVLYQDYKIKKLKEVTDRVKYTLDLDLTKIDDEWKMNDLNDIERQKIHGLYSL